MLLTTAALAATISIPLTVTVTNPTSTAAGLVTVSVGAATTLVAIPAVPPPVVVVTPPPPPPPTGVSWVYHAGKFIWGGDWSFAATPSYADTSVPALSGAANLKVTYQTWGGWQPYLNANCQSNKALCFDTTPYKFIFFSARPTKANTALSVGFMSSGDTNDGLVLGANGNSDLAQYCSGGNNPAVGAWETCKIPLSAFKLIDTTVLKFWISDQSGSADVVYLAEVGFSAT